MIIWLQKCCAGCCHRYKIQQKFFHFLFNFGDTSNSFYFIDMPPIKQQLAYLKNLKLVLIKHFKKQKLERSQSINTQQLCIENNQLRTSNTSNTKDRKSVWFWNESANKTNQKSDKKELDCRPEESRTEKKAVLKTQLGEI